MVYPDYYPEFSCIAGACRHNCCMGWEIDIDEVALERFSKVEGELGQRLRENIFMEDTPHFELNDEGCCPMLNKDGLCDLILELGEDSLCEICREHPRFYNELSTHTEVGLGLCCEEVARLVLSRTEPVKLMGDLPDEPDEIFLDREKCFAIAQNRNEWIIDRGMELRKLAGGGPVKSTRGWFHVLKGLERKNVEWFTDWLYRLEKPIDFQGFAEFIVDEEDRETEYEQFLVYMLYRHVGKSRDCFETDWAIRFAAWSCEMLWTLGAAKWSRTGTFTFEDQVELVRLFSEEVEYSEENLEKIMDLMVLE